MCIRDISEVLIAFTFPSNQRKHTRVRIGSTRYVDNLHNKVIYPTGNTFQYYADTTATTIATYYTSTVDCCLYNNGYLLEVVVCTTSLGQLSITSCKQTLCVQTR